MSRHYDGEISDDCSIKRSPFICKKRNYTQEKLVTNQGCQNQEKDEEYNFDENHGMVRLHLYMITALLLQIGNNPIRELFQWYPESNLLVSMFTSCETDFSGVGETCGWGSLNPTDISTSYLIAATNCSRL